MQKHKLDVQKREPNKNLTQLRLNHIVPANVFGADRESQSIQLDMRSFRQTYDEVGESNVAYLQLEDEEVPAMIEEVQKEPVSDVPIHVSFRVVDLKKTITSEIPIEIVGEFELAEAVLVVVRDEIEVEALPTDLPEKFEIDVSGLNEIGQSIDLKDLEYDADKVKILVGEGGMDAPVVLIQEVEEEPEEPEEPIETEIIGEEEAAEEGEEVGAAAEVEDSAEQPQEEVEE